MPTTSAFLHHLHADVRDDAVCIHIAPEHLNRGGRVHGGLLATMLDSVMGHTVSTCLPEGRSTATASLTVTFLEPAFLGDELYATAAVVRQGSSLVTVEGSVTRKGDGVLIARALGTFAVTRPRAQGA